MSTQKVAIGTKCLATVVVEMWAWCGVCVSFKLLPSIIPHHKRQRGSLQQHFLQPSDPQPAECSTVFFVKMNVRISENPDNNKRILMRTDWMMLSKSMAQLHVSAWGWRYFTLDNIVTESLSLHPQWCLIRILIPRDNPLSVYHCFNRAVCDDWLIRGILSDNRQRELDHCVRRSLDKKTRVLLNSGM